MSKALLQLPPCRCDALNLKQAKQIADIENFWCWILARVDWLQSLDVGLRPQDPLDRPDIQKIESRRQMLDVMSRYHYARLQLCIIGWELIKQMALSSQKYIPFASPRELFLHICLTERESDILDATNGDVTELHKQAEKFQLEQKLYRSKLSTEAVQVQLKPIRGSVSWGDFIIYAVWDKRHSSYERPDIFWTMRDKWKDFLKAHKDVAIFLKALQVSRASLRSESVRLGESVASKERSADRKKVVEFRGTNTRMQARGFGFT